MDRDGHVKRRRRYFVDQVCRYVTANEFRPDVALYQLNNSSVVLNGTGRGNSNYVLTVMRFSQYGVPICSLKNSRHFGSLNNAFVAESGLAVAMYWGSLPWARASRF